MSERARPGSKFALAELRAGLPCAADRCPLDGFGRGGDRDDRPCGLLYPPTRGSGIPTAGWPAVPATTDFQFERVFSERAKSGRKASGRAAANVRWMSAASWMAPTPPRADRERTARSRECSARERERGGRRRAAPRLACGRCRRPPGWPPAPPQAGREGTAGSRDCSASRRERGGRRRATPRPACGGCRRPPGWPPAPPRAGHLLGAIHVDDGVFGHAGSPNSLLMDRTLA